MQSLSLWKKIEIYYRTKSLEKGTETTKATVNIDHLFT